MSAIQAAVFHTKQKPESPLCDGKPANDRELKPSIISAPIMETDFARLEDGSLLEMIEDPEDSSKTLFATRKNGAIDFVDQVDVGERILRPLPREAKFVRHVRLSRGAKPYESVDALLWNINEVFCRCLDLEDDYRFLLATFVVSTWFIDCLPVAPYIALVGLPRSGKSTVLKALSLLCRRSLLTADLTSAALYQVCDRLGPTLMIDETGTAGQQRQLCHLLRTGTSPDLVALRKDKSFKAFSAKVVSWNELPNDSALNSRCVVIPLHETQRANLLRPSDPEIVDAADDLQKQLLQYRLEKFEEFRTPSLPKIPGDERLFSRSRDLYQALAFACRESTHYCNWLRLCLERQQDFHREPLYPTHAALLRFLFFHIHSRPNDELLTVGDLTNALNDFIKWEEESFRLSPREVGATLTTLGLINRKRSRNGWEISIDRQDQKRIHDLMTFYGIDNHRQQISLDSYKNCDLCTNLKDPMVWAAKVAFEYFKE